MPELEAFHESLKVRGLKTNSRRRKVMTAKSFLRFLSGKVDLSFDLSTASKWIAPEKVEKPPKIVARSVLVDLANEQPQTPVGLRNKALIFLLLETGMLVTEALALSTKDIEWNRNSTGEILGASIRVFGKRARSMHLCQTTAKYLSELCSVIDEAKSSKHSKETSSSSSSRYFFYGYSKGGPNPDRLTARGVEVLFKTWAEQRALKQLKPRVLRHVFVVDQLRAGKSESEIMALLGLKTGYPFRVYRQLIVEIEENTAALNRSLNPLLKPHQDTVAVDGNRATVENRQVVKEKNSSDRS